MFHFPAFPPTILCIQMAVPAHDCGWVSPFGHPGITAWLTAPPGLSRPPTSFIGSWCQGIHRLPYTTSQQTNDPLNSQKKLRKTHCRKTRCSRPLCTSQPTTNHHPAPTPTEQLRRYANRWQSCVLPENSRPSPVLVSSGSNRVFSLQTSGLRDH